MAWSRKNPKKQTRLQFQSLPAASSAAKDDYSSAVQDRLANVRYSGARRQQPTPNKNSLPTPEPSSAPKAQISPPPDSPPSSSSNLPEQRTPAHVVNDNSSTDEDDIPLPSSKRRRLSTNIANVTLTSSPRRSTRLVVSSPLQRLRQSRAVRAQADKPVAGNAWLDVGSPETSGDEADAVVTKPQGRHAGKTQAKDNDPFIVGDDQLGAASADEVPKKSTRKASTKVTDDFMVNDDEVEYITSDEEPQPARSKKSSNKEFRKRSHREQAELEEDLLDLQDSEHDQDVQRTRTRGGPVTTQRDEVRTHLARLKQKRAGRRMPRTVISDDDEAEDLAQQESDEDGIDIDYITQEHAQIDRDTSKSPARSLIGSPEPHPELYDNGNEEEEDDFVVEDIEPTASLRHNRPNPDIPLQFTSFASAKPKELFIHIIEWMIKNKVSPAFSRDDDLYNLSFNRIDDQVKAQAGSRLISAAWNATFKHAILARPIMTVEALPGLDEDHLRTCDACNRTNHPARYDFRFTGTPYNKDTLEPLEADDEKDSDSRSSQTGDDLDDGTDDQAEHISQHSNQSYDDQGHLLPKTSVHFYLGRYCAAAAEMGHKLTHWKHHLNTEVLSYLSDQGVLSAEEIVRRDRQSHKKREKEAENIVDSMQETGVIRELWQRFQDDLDDARWGMEGHETKSGKGRSNQRIGNVRVSGADGRIGEWMEGGKYKEILRVDSDDSDA